MSHKPALRLCRRIGLGVICVLFLLSGPVPHSVSRDRDGYMPIDEFQRAEGVVRSDYSAAILDTLNLFTSMKYGLDEEFDGCLFDSQSKESAIVRVLHFFLQEERKNSFQAGNSESGVERIVKIMAGYCQLPISFVGGKLDKSPRIYKGTETFAATPLYTKIAYVKGFLDTVTVLRKHGPVRQTFIRCVEKLSASPELSLILAGEQQASRSSETLHRFDAAVLAIFAGLEADCGLFSMPTK